MLLGEEASIWEACSRASGRRRNSFGLVSFDEVTHALEAQRRAHAEKQESERRLAQKSRLQSWCSTALPADATAAQNAGVRRDLHPGRKVGGDYYDFLDLGQERLGFVIGDISGRELRRLC